MLIRPSQLLYLNDILRDWQDASLYTKMVIALESAIDGRGFTLYELSLVLFPKEKNEKEEPTLKAIGKTNYLRNHVRKSPANNWLVPYARLTALKDDNGENVSAWLTSNIANQQEFDPVKKRIGKIIHGYRKNIHRFNRIVDLGMEERFYRYEKYVRQQYEERQLKELVTNKKKRNKQK